MLEWKDLPENVGKLTDPFTSTPLICTYCGAIVDTSDQPTHFCPRKHMAYVIARKNERKSKRTP